jgi:hypothetical protein
VTEENHLATVQDFKAARELESHVERVTLPSLGKAGLMRRPSPLWFIFHGSLPATLAARATGVDGEGSVQTADDIQAVARWVTDLLGEVLVQPRVSLAPGPGQISPDWIADEDLNFIIRWALGEVALDGSDLASFRGKPESRVAGADR